MKEYALLLILAAITDNMLLVHALGTDWLTLIRREDRSLPTAFWLLLGINTLTSLAKAWQSPYTPSFVRR